MAFKGTIVRDKSYDPYYTVEFSYITDEIMIDKGYAEVMRKAPRPSITYDPETQKKLQLFDRTKIELEILNLVMNFWFQKQSGK